MYEMRLLRLFLIVATVMSAATSTAKAQTWDCGELPGTLTASINSDGTLTVRGTGAMADYSFDAGNESYNTPWQSSQSSITGVVVEVGVTSIGSYAFAACEKLVYVSIPNSAASIGEGAFRDCGSLRSVTIPDSVRTIGERAFFGCSGLTSAVIGGGVAAIRGGTFAYCASLTSVTIGGGVTAIGEGAFARCENLTSVTIPDRVATVGTLAFAMCEKLTSVTIGSRVTSIGNQAFMYCYGLKSVTFPAGVVSIGSEAFRNCTALTSITALRSTPPAAAGDAFWGIPSSACLYVPAASDVTGYKAASGWGVINCVQPVTRECVITFGVVGGNGKLSATVDGKPITSGARVDYGKSVVFTAAPNAGFSVTGWTLNDSIVNGAGIIYTLSVSLPSAVTVQFAVPKYVVSYDLNGGIFRKDITVVMYDSYNHPQSDGWNGAFLRINVNGIDIDSFTILTGASCTLSFAANTGERVNIYWNRGGTFDDECAFAVYYTPAPPYVAPKFNPASDADNDGSAFLLYRQYGDLTRKQTGELLGSIDVRGGLDNHPLAEGRKADVLLPDGKNLYRRGYVFAGWNTNAVGTGTNYNSGAVMTIAAPSANVVMYARWKLDTYTVTFNANGGDALAPSSAVTGEGWKLASLPLPEKRDDPFIGWYTAPSGGAAVTDSYVYSGNTTIYARFESTVSVKSGARAVPPASPNAEAVVTAPAIVFAGEFTAGPNPIARSIGEVKFYRQGKRVSGTLSVYDATGNVVGRVKITDSALGSQARRKVGSWDLKDRKGRVVPEGAYLVKGVLKMSDGKMEKVSVIVGVR